MIKILYKVSIKGDIGMSKRIISYDLGTGGNKASLYDIEGKCLSSAFVPYNT